MIRRPPRSTQSRSSAASDVYKRQVLLVLLSFNLTTSILWQGCHRGEPQDKSYFEHKIQPYESPSQIQFSKNDRSLMQSRFCLLYTSPSPRDVEESRMPSSA
eukprot:TRINITY_DN5080_c0_g1_i1.p2 TRINITY_DN5080_c0_g1~~TRINITY_DN5080_c0_g1_i1.p2  ORF type:complete len:102 (+),score=63.17 TRINITY_DN5080_c0_g1_i1:12-317(+)